jgi:hypothetical protein
MWDNLHPFSTGYAKMAGVWKGALDVVLLPEANDDSLTISEDSGAAAIASLANDDGFGLSIQGWQPSTDPDTAGDVEVDGTNQALLYTPPDDFLQLTILAAPAMRATRL